MSAALQWFGQPRSEVLIGDDQETNSSQPLRLFILVQVTCQIALLVPQLAPLRLLFRLLAFGISLYYLFTVRAELKRSHPSGATVIWVLAIYCLSLFNPSMNTLTAAAAQIALNVAIVAPVFWVTRLKMTHVDLNRALLLFWGFHAASAALGVIQTYFPGRFQPPVSIMVSSNEMEGFLESLMIQTSSGEMVFRPMGLTDIPGGAGNAGYYTILLGLGFFLSEERWSRRLFFLATMLLGAAALVLSQVRAVFVTAAVGVAVVALALAWRREGKKLAAMLHTLAIVVLCGFLLAMTLGGEGATSRLEAFLEDDATEVYRANRGHFLDYTVEVLLPEFPLGAGLGRWGMMNSYFGDNTNLATQPIWVEIQWTGWLLDGGIPLIIAYSAAIIMAIWVMLRLLRSSRTVWLWAAIVLAYDIGAVALTFSYPVFIGSNGLEFWLLNASVFAAYCTEIERSRQGMIALPVCVSKPRRALLGRRAW